MCHIKSKRWLFFVRSETIQYFTGQKAKSRERLEQQTETVEAEFSPFNDSTKLWIDFLVFTVYIQLLKWSVY